MRSARQLFAQRRILLDGVPAADGSVELPAFCRVEADGALLQAREALYLMLHKPRGCVSATRDRKNPTVLGLIDLPGKEELHLAGRLDFNTTGLLLLSNDGRWTSQITLPQQKVPKTYRVETRREITAEYVQKFAEGIYLRYEDLTTRPAALVLLSATTAELTIHEGRYHQVKRMFGYFRNEVLALHRLSVGDIVLDARLAPGEYRPLTAAEVASVWASSPGREPACDRSSPVPGKPSGGRN